LGRFWFFFFFFKTFQKFKFFSNFKTLKHLSTFKLISKHFLKLHTSKHKPCISKYEAQALIVSKIIQNVI
jgi:hypothetical protein